MNAYHLFSSRGCRRLAVLIVAACCLNLGLQGVAHGQKLDSFERERSLVILGKLVVLIDSRSGSCAELFARMVQLEKFGTVIGDHSAGAVMESRYYPMQIGNDTVVFYGASITAADLIMSDGKSLERVGVTPDELVLPTAADLAAKRDPVLARAAELLGFKIEPEKAGVMFPIEWRR